MQPTHLVIHYAEIGLKGRNRHLFEEALVTNIKQALTDTGLERVRRMGGRIVVPVEGVTIDMNQVRENLSRVFGIAHFSPAIEVKQNIDDIKTGALEIVNGTTADWQTFKVIAKRSNKLFPATSMELNAMVGEYILENIKGKSVDVHQPELSVRIEIVEKIAFIYAEKFPGPGGLPVGVSGKVVSLLSGGIDSPVASWGLMKRGCDVIFVHFHSMPQTDRASVEKVQELAAELSKWQRSTKLYLVPFLDIQKEIVKETKGEYRVVLYRRFMYRLADLIAKQERAKALVTGESVGQVASQTLDNIAAINDVVTIPILRPLIGMDKEEIITRAQNINTYELSIAPFDDCCSLFVPRHPVTKARIDIARAEEAKTKIDELIEQAMNQVEIIQI